MPTHLIRSWVVELAKKLRNSEDYDDFGYGTEPIPGDKTWTKCANKCKTCACRMKKANDKEQ